MTNANVAIIVLVFDLGYSISSCMNSLSSTSSVTRDASGFFCTFLTYLLTKMIPTVSITTNAIARYHKPENNGSSAIECAVPTFAAVVKPQAKPTTVEINIIAVDAIRSNPNFKNKGSNAGKKIRDASIIPVIATNSASAKEMTGIISNPL